MGVRHWRERDSEERERKRRVEGEGKEESGAKQTAKGLVISIHDWLLLGGDGMLISHDGPLLGQIVAKQ
jgi:hypothetical protein